MSDFSLCVYCGSRGGAHPAYLAAARQVGHWIGANGATLVYGGGRVGLMGALADATLTAGGRVIGIIPRSLMNREVGHTNLSELHVVETMHERKRMMAERASAFLALPGGLGTLEELFEVWTWRQLGYHDQPIGVLDVEGYYALVRGFLAHAGEQGFVTGPQLGLVDIGQDAVPLLQRLRKACAQATGTDDYRRI